MILNDNQLRATKRELAELFRARASWDEALTLYQSQNHPSNCDLTLGAQANLDQLGDEIEALQGQIEQYEATKNFSSDRLKLTDLEGLGLLLPELRIMRGLSQAALAKILGTTQQTISRYESARYRIVPLSKILEVLSALNARIEGEVYLGEREECD